jgi:hypothetical protein
VCRKCKENVDARGRLRPLKPVSLGRVVHLERDVVGNPEGAPSEPTPKESDRKGAGPDPYFPQCRAADRRPRHTGTVARWLSGKTSTKGKLNARCIVSGSASRNTKATADVSASQCGDANALEWRRSLWQPDCFRHESAKGHDPDRENQMNPSPDWNRDLRPTTYSRRQLPTGRW